MSSNAGDRLKTGTVALKVQDGSSVVAMEFQQGAEENVRDFFVRVAARLRYLVKADELGPDADLLQALKDLYASYKALGDSGDAGFWNLDETPEGKAALAAIAQATGQEVEVAL